MTALLGVLRCTSPTVVSGLRYTERSLKKKCPHLNTCLGSTTQLAAQYWFDADELRCACLLIDSKIQPPTKAPQTAPLLVVTCCLCKCWSATCPELDVAKSPRLPDTKRRRRERKLSEKPRLFPATQDRKKERSFILQSLS